MADDPKEDPKDNPKDDPKGAEDEALREEGKRALESERKLKREAEKRAEELAKRLKEIEDKDKSEVEKLREQVEQQNKALADAETKSLRLEIGTAKGLTPAQARRLVGSTKEELEADADELLQAFSGKSADNDEGKPDPVNRPKPSLQGGSDPTTHADPDVREIVSKIPRSAF